MTKRKKRARKRKARKGKVMVLSMHPKPFMTGANRIKYCTTVMSQLEFANFQAAIGPVVMSVFTNYPGTGYFINAAAGVAGCRAMINSTRLARLMALFDMYRVTRVTVRWQPVTNSNIPAAPNAGIGEENTLNNLFIIYDEDDYALNNEIQFQNMSPTPQNAFRTAQKAFTNKKPPLLNCANYQPTTAFLTAVSVNNNPTQQNQFGAVKVFCDNVAAAVGAIPSIAGVLQVEWVICFYGTQAAQA